MSITHKNAVSQEKQQSRTPPFGGDLAIYIHWPFCKSKCPYCDFNSHVRDGIDQQRWKNALLSELRYWHAQLPGRRVASIFFGGGTPSLMPPGTAQALIAEARKLWPVADDIEITLEANPTSVETHTFADFKAAGVNRVSLGVQSFDDKELKFLGRGHSAREALIAIERARHTFDRYSFDLIYARPQQSLQAWREELSQALGHIGGHMSLYQLTIEENTAFHHAYKNGGFTLPHEEESEALYLLTEEMLRAKGLNAYEVSNYAKPGEESRHNLAYWKGDDYIGVGPGAHGRITIPAERGGAAPNPNQTPRQAQGRMATAALKSPERWLAQVESAGHGLELREDLSPRQELEERLMMGLRLVEGIDYSAFETKTGMDLRRVLDARKLALFERQGLLAARGDALQATLKGRLVLSALTAALLTE